MLKCASSSHWNPIATHVKETCAEHKNTVTELWVISTIDSRGSGNGQSLISAYQGLAKYYYELPCFKKLFYAKFAQKCTYLAFEAIRMVVLSEGPKSWSFCLSFCRYNCPFTSDTPVGLFLGPVLCTVDNLIFVQDKFVVGQVFTTCYTGEAF